jgi:hypothetical protein
MLRATTVLVCGFGLATASLAGLDPIFDDGFESGNTLAWTSSTEPAPAAIEAFRFSDLDLRDPHLFVDVPVFGCSDFTDNPLPLNLAPAFNTQLATAITTDGDGDTFLDLSTILQFRPWNASAVAARLDLADGLCAAPSPPTSCSADPLALPQTTVYDGLANGTCLEAVAGTTSGYSPAVGTALGPCFVSQPRLLNFGFGLSAVPFRALQLAATPTGNPTDTFTLGLLRGFLRESDANTILLPADLPLVGGQPIAILLAGGTGNCAAGDDRDSFEGHSGWWFYFAFEAAAVDFAG